VVVSPLSEVGPTNALPEGGGTVAGDVDVDVALEGGEGDRVVR
jgi:hypothetical protein